MDTDTATTQTLEYTMGPPPDNTTGSRFVAQVPGTSWTFSTDEVYEALDEAWKLFRAHESLCLVWDFAADGDFTTVDPQASWVVGAAYVGD